MGQRQKHIPLLTLERLYQLTKGGIFLKKLFMFFLAFVLLINTYPLQAASDKYYFDANTGFWMTNSNGTTVQTETLTRNGDSTLVTIKNSTSTVYVLVDAGNSSDVASELRKRNITTINYCIITHNHIDHMRGLNYFYKLGANEKRIVISKLYVSTYEYDKISNYVDYLTSGKSISSNGTTTTNTNHKSTLYKISPVSSNTSNATTAVGTYTTLIHPMFNTNSYIRSFTTPGGAVSDAAMGNNASMMVVIRTSAAKVVLGGDIYAYTVSCINNNLLINGTSTKIDPETGKPVSVYTGTPLWTSYVNALNSYVFNDNLRYTVYKVSHHGIRTFYNTTNSSNYSSFTTVGGTQYNLLENGYTIDKNLFKKIKPNAIILTGNSENSDDEKYFGNIFDALIESTNSYEVFSQNAF